MDDVLDVDDDAFDVELADVDIDLIARQRRESNAFSRPASSSPHSNPVTNPSTTTTTKRPRARPHVWMDVVRDNVVRVSCSHERLRAGFAGKLYAAVDGFAVATPATPDDAEAGAAWDVPMRLAKKVRDALCAMNAFERGYSRALRKNVAIGAPPARTAEYASAPPGYCGVTKRGGEEDEEKAHVEVDRRFGTIAGNIRRALYPFQETGVKFAIRRNGRALIADQMGVGKTLQAIAVADAYRYAGPLLVIVPAAMRFVWADEI